MDLRKKGCFLRSIVALNFLTLAKGSGTAKARYAT